MFCENCGTNLPDNNSYCTACGTPTNRDNVAEQEPIIAEQEPVVINEEQTVVEPTAFPQPTYEQPTYYAAPQPQAPVITSEEDLPEEYRPLSPISYFGLTMLYSVPIVGLIFMIIFSFNRSNIHRRNFTLSFWIPTIIVSALAILALVIMLLFFPIFTGTAAPRMAYNEILQM